MVWIESLHNLHCPTCDSRLIEPAGRHDVLGRADPVYLVDGHSAVCPNGHTLPEPDELYAYRDRAGHPMEISAREVPPPG